MHSELATVSMNVILGDETFEISKNKKTVIVKGKDIVPQDFRDTHKSVTFSKLYKGGWKRIYGVLAKYINMFRPAHEREQVSKAISSAIDKAIPELSAYLDSCIKLANTPRLLDEEWCCYLRTSKLGRIRFFKGDDYGEAANAPIQGTNAEACKLAMIWMFQYFEKMGWGRIVLSVHDELVCSVPRIHAEEARAKLEEVMIKSLGYFLDKIPSVADAKICEHWEK